MIAHVRSASLVVRAADMHGWWADPLSRFQTTTFTKIDTSIPARGGTMRARIYKPASRRARTVLLTGGVHAKGIDEPRLVKLAGDLAAGEARPWSRPKSRICSQYRITPALTDAIEDATAWVSGQRALASDGKIGLFGISFAGGLSIAAAGRPRVRDRVAYVAVVRRPRQPRTCRALPVHRHSSPMAPIRKPHDYGVVVALINAAERVVPPEQVRPLREGIVTLPDASQLDMVDKGAARAEFDRARALERAMPAPASTLIWLRQRRGTSKPLGAALILPHSQGSTTRRTLARDFARPDRARLPDSRRRRQCRPRHRIAAARRARFAAHARSPSSSPR